MNIIETLKKQVIKKTWACDWDGWLEKKWKKLKEKIGGSK
jgi:hypothetical protein